MNVTMNYRLSADGQRAALLAGRPATATVAETVDETIDAATLALCDIDGNGKVSYAANAPEKKNNEWASEYLYLSAPPANLADLIATHQAWKKDTAALYEAGKLEKARIASQKAAAEAAEVALDEPVVEAALRTIEALPPLADINSSVPGFHCLSMYDGLIVKRDGRLCVQTGAQFKRAVAVYESRVKTANDAKAAAAAEKEAKRQTEIETRGGYVFPVEGGMCTFKGRGLWLDGQARRWVGIFTEPKGIAEFLDSPRGEHSFSVSSLAPGDCIQGAGFDTNSRGKRRTESEWYGVVVSLTDSEIVVRITDSRAECFKIAAKMAETLRQQLATTNQVTTDAEPVAVQQ